jgi:hypothetical protein
MTTASTPAFVPESLIVFMLKHSSAFEWVCINCNCRAELQNETCGTPGGRWQAAQGHTGIDVVARLKTPRHPWFSGLAPASTTAVLEAKGDRLKPTGGINRPAYNEMTGGLSAFFLSNLGRIRDHPDRVYGWLVPATFHQCVIEDFREATANLGLALPPKRDFLIGTFDGRRFWGEAPPGLHALARDWFGAKQAARNALLQQRFGQLLPDLREFADRLFAFEVVRGSQA